MRMIYVGRRHNIDCYRYNDKKFIDVDNEEKFFYDENQKLDGSLLYEFQTVY